MMASADRLSISPGERKALVALLQLEARPGGSWVGAKDVAVEEAGVSVGTASQGRSAAAARCLNTLWEADLVLRKDTGDKSSRAQRWLYQISPRGQRLLLGSAR